MFAKPFKRRFSVVEEIMKNLEERGGGGGC